MESSRGNWKGIYYIKFKGDICLEGSGRRVKFLRGSWKPLCKHGVLYTRFLIYADAVWRLYDVYIGIGEFSNFLGGHM